MICLIDQNVIAFEAIGHREIGYGQKVNFKTDTLLLKISIKDFTLKFAKAYIDFIEDYKNDETLSGVSDPQYIKQLNYPSLSTLLHYENYANNLFTKYLYFEFLEIFFNKYNASTLKYIINDIINLKIKNDLIEFKMSIYQAKDQ